LNVNVFLDVTECSLVGSYFSTKPYGITSQKVSDVHYEILSCDAFLQIRYKRVHVNCSEHNSSEPDGRHTASGLGSCSDLSNSKSTTLKR
jgi:hypothetical protein